MLDFKFIDDIAKKLTKALPANFQQFETDMQQKFRDILQGVFAKLDLVTREEFDAQVKVLARTRAKLESLEKKFHDSFESHKTSHTDHPSHKHEKKDHKKGNKEK